MKIGSPHHHKFLIFLQRRSTTNWKIVARHGMYNQILHAVTIADCNNCFVIIAVVHNNDVFDHQQIVILYSLMIDNSIQCRSYDKKYRARSHPPTQGLWWLTCSKRRDRSTQNWWRVILQITVTGEGGGGGDDNNNDLIPLSALKWSSSAAVTATTTQQPRWHQSHRWQQPPRLPLETTTNRGKKRRTMIQVTATGDSSRGRGEQRRWQRQWWNDERWCRHRQVQWVSPKTRIPYDFSSYVGHTEVEILFFVARTEIRNFCTALIMRFSSKEVSHDGLLCALDLRDFNR